MNSQQPTSSHLLPQAGVAPSFQQARPETVNRFVPTIPGTSSPEVYNSSFNPGEAPPHLSAGSYSSPGYDLASSPNPPPVVSIFNEAESADINGFVPDPPAVKMMPRSEGASEDQANAEDSFEEISL